jgi:hypothetical protein
MELKFELNTALTVKCISAVACALGFTKVSVALANAQLAIANTLVLFAIIFVIFGQRPTPKKVMMSPVEVAKLLQDALDIQPTIIGQPNDDNLLALKEKLLDVLQTISYDRADGFHHVVGVMQTKSAYMTDHEGNAFPIPKRLGLWDDKITKDATVVKMKKAEAIHKLAPKTTKSGRQLRMAAKSPFAPQWKKCTSTNSKMAQHSSIRSLRVTSSNTLRRSLLAFMPLASLHCT